MTCPKNVCVPKHSVFFSLFLSEVSDLLSLFQAFGHFSGDDRKRRRPQGDERVLVEFRTGYALLYAGFLDRRCSVGAIYTGSGTKTKKVCLSLIRHFPLFC